ncbi:MAG: hypothetical protein Ta2B_06180 [Termitinemataceae bacterium]|nr:MAG: hypothetical protein Ta2B_06180 [Termitinemataceae bacterium]
MNKVNIPVSLKDAFVLSIAMGAVIFICRAIPFIFFRNTGSKKLQTKSNSETIIGFVEIIAPPVAMTVLTFNEISSRLVGIFQSVNTKFAHLPQLQIAGIVLLDAIPVAAASAVTAILHLWKRNSLLSIFCGTALFMLLGRVL